MAAGRCRANTIYNNYTGAYANGGTFTGNRVYDNHNEGILFSSGTTITGNVVYSNSAYGLEGGNNSSAVTTISNNLIYANGSGGFDSTAPANIDLLSNTIYQLTGAGITATNSGPLTSADALVFRDNIVGSLPLGNTRSTISLSRGLAADSPNDIHVLAPIIASLAGHAITSSAAWEDEAGEDLHSIYVDPLFVSPAGADGILGYSGGVDHGADDNFNVQSGSPTIDAADPSLPFSNEPAPNGGRANQGYTGGTAQATPSPAHLIQVISPNSNIRVQQGQALPITWNTTGINVSNPDSAYSSTVLSQNPLVYLKFDESTGTTAADSSGNGLNGLYVNGPALDQTGYAGWSGQRTPRRLRRRNGCGHRFLLLPWALTRTVTMSAWINPSTLAPTWQPIFYKGAGDYHHRTYSVFLNTAGFLLLSSWDGSMPRS